MDEVGVGGSVHEVGFSVDGGINSDWCCDDEVLGRSSDAEEAGVPFTVEDVSFDDVCEGLRDGGEDTEYIEHKIH